MPPSFSDLHQQWSAQHQVTAQLAQDAGVPGSDPTLSVGVAASYRAMLETEELLKAATAETPHDVAAKLGTALAHARVEFGDDLPPEWRMIASAYRDLVALASETMLA